MSNLSIQDPFYVVKEEVTQAFQGINTLYERWKELLGNINTSNYEEFQWTTNELKSGIKTIEWDISDLEETISIVENNRNKFKIEQSEIENRKKFVLEIKSKIQSIKDDMNGSKTKGILDKYQRNLLMNKRDQGDKFSRLESAMVQDNEQFIQSQKKRQEEILAEQDRDLEQLSHTVVNLKQVGNTINTSLKEQEQLITEIEVDTEKVDKGLRGSLKRISDLIDSTKDSTQWCIIILLILILVGLIFLVFYI